MAIVKRRITIGTRASLLARTQTAHVVALLRAEHSQIEAAIVTITTQGDRVQDRPLHAIGAQALFIAEFEAALRTGTIDIAVHSAKDLPAALPEDMALVAFPGREDPRDALIATGGYTLATLPHGARVGTSSLRRACLLRAIRPDLVLGDLRGNIDTRLRKLHDGEHDAIVLAAAGLARIGRIDEASELIDPQRMIPAVGQGVLAVEARAGDSEIAYLLASLDDRAARTAISAERAFLRVVAGGCAVPVAAYAQLGENELVINGMVGAVDGRLVRGVRTGLPVDAAALGAALASEILAAGGAALLGRNP